MIAWFAGVQIAVAVVGALLAIVLGLVGRKPSDLTMAPLAIVELLLIVQIAVSIVAPLVGNEPSGSLLEYWVYLISAALLPIAGGFWALIERSRWSTVVIGVVCLAVAVMVYRMTQIWFVQGL
ncbi:MULTISPECIES: hypothetical protein [unclassified Leifsonia]|uniref:hypothetical protein n=1 Tax=unclassified Leifsonia TaxID=2663824 RepID=UPI0006F449A1|nr:MULTISPECIES: hypothetical protein [unclassified Leifsonia]KQX06559.1 hypothetical protein ASC59_01470 [Leifsonia sp. Root1293]KRA10843.1 hypothetical protein ASD61_01470 [Leifsonia sp. Root60]